MPSKARELRSDVQHLPAYRKPDMTGRVSADELWHRALARHQPGMRVTVTFVKPGAPERTCGS